MKKIILIEGMVCGHCALHVEEAIRTIAGVASVSVKHRSGKAVVSLKSDVSDEKFKSVINSTGYTFAGIS